MECLRHDFGTEFEQCVINTLLLTPNFLDKYVTIVKPEAFVIDNNKFLVQLLLEYHSKYHATPSLAIIRDIVQTSEYRDKGGVLEIVDGAEPIADLQYVVDRIVKWAKWTAIDIIIRNCDGQSPHEFIVEIEKAARIGDEVVLSHTKLHEDDERDEEREVAEKIATPWAWLNEQLDGGPEIGDLAVMMTVISGGKTTALVNIARHALKLGKFVVYFTFEDGERKIKRRLTQSITESTRQEMVTCRADIIRRRNRFLLKYGGRCEIKDLQSRRSTVADVATFIKTLEDTSNRKVDVVITDYADRFRATGRYSEPRHALREIFEDCKWLARHLKVVHWTARQVNKSMVGKDIIGADAASESWGSMESPDLVISLGRTIEDEQIDRIVLFTAKVRDEKDHQSVSLITDFEKQRIRDGGVV